MVAVFFVTWRRVVWSGLSGLYWSLWRVFCLLRVCPLDLAGIPMLRMCVIFFTLFLNLDCILLSEVGRVREEKDGLKLGRKNKLKEIKKPLPMSLPSPKREGSTFTST